MALQKNIGRLVSGEQTNKWSVALSQTNENCTVAAFDLWYRLINSETAAQPVLFCLMEEGSVELE